MKVRFFAAWIIFIACSRLAVNCTAAIGAQVGYAADTDGEQALNLEDYPRAESLFRAKLANKSGGEQEPYWHVGLGEALLWQGKNTEAAKELRRAYKLIDKAEPVASVLRSRVLDDLSWLDEAQNDPIRALSDASLALNALQPLAKENPTQMCDILEHLGYLKRQAGLYSEASDHYRQTAQINATVFGVQSVQASEDNDQLAMLAWRQGNKSQGDALFTQAMQVKWNNPALFSSYTPHYYTQTVTYHFDVSAPNCASVDRSGQRHETIHINGVTVSASIEPAGNNQKFTTVSLSVVNESQYPIQFLSKAPLLYAYSPKETLCRLLDPDALAQKIENKGEKSAKWVRFWGQDKTTSVTSTFIGRPYGWGYPPVVSCNNNVPFISRNGDFTQVTTQVPDYAGRARALQKAAEIEDTARQKAQTIRRKNIGAAIISPANSISGSLYFDPQIFEKALLQIPVGNAVFEFQFPPNS